MIKAWVLLFYITLSWWPLLTWCTTLGSHSHQKWTPDLEPFFIELKKEAIEELKKHPRAFSVKVATPVTSTATNTETHFSKVLQADVKRIFDDVRKDFDPEGSLSTTGYAKDVHSTMDYTEAKAPTRSRTTEEPWTAPPPLASAIEIRKEKRALWKSFVEGVKKIHYSRKESICASTKGKVTEGYVTPTVTPTVHMKFLEDILNGLLFYIERLTGPPLEKDTVCPTTEETVSMESQATEKSTSTTTTTTGPSTVPDVESEYFNELKPMMDSFFDVFFKVAGPESKKQTTIEGHVSSESQAAKKYAKNTHSTESYTKSEAGGQTTQSYQDGYSATVHPVSVDYPVRIGSVKGVPGIDFPHYTDIPLTSFSCSDMNYLPGFYADLDTRCQVFHACWPNRRESFLCPLGTVFNQALLACDYWYSTNCSLAPHYYNVNAETSQLNKTEGKTLSSMISSLLQKSADSQSTNEDSSKAVPVTPETLVALLSQFLPVKAKVVIYPDTAGKRAKIVASASVGGDTMKKVRVEKPPRQLRVVQEQRPDTTESSSVPYSTEQSASTEVPKYASKEAVDLILNRLADSVKKIIKDYDDIMDRNYTGKPRSWPVLDESKYKAHPDMRVLDESAQKLLDKISDGMLGFLYDGAKRLDMEKTESKKTESSKTAPVKTYTLTQLNPRFIIKPIDVPKEVKHTKSVPDPTQSSIKVTSTTKRTTIVKPSGQHSGPGISPLTKKALAKNYFRFLRAKSG